MYCTEIRSVLPCGSDTSVTNLKGIHKLMVDFKHKRRESVARMCWTRWVNSLWNRLRLLIKDGIPVDYMTKLHRLKRLIYVSCGVTLGSPYQTMNLSFVVFHTHQQCAPVVFRELIPSGGSEIVPSIINKFP